MQRLAAAARASGEATAWGGFGSDVDVVCAALVRAPSRVTRAIPPLCPCRRHPRQSEGNPPHTAPLRAPQATLLSVDDEESRPGALPPADAASCGACEMVMACAMDQAPASPSLALVRTEP